MSKEAYYFKHFCNARNDRKIKKARLQLGIEAYAMYFMILEVLREQQDFKYPFEDIDVLADDFDVSIQKVEVIIKNYGLFVIDENENFFSIAQIKGLEKWIELKEINRIKGIKSGIIRKQKMEQDIQKLSLSSSTKPPPSSGSVVDELLYSNIEYSIQNNIKNSTINKKDYFKFVEQMRQKYAGNGDKNFLPTFFVYDEQEIAISTNERLYSKSTRQPIAPHAAFELWEYIYMNQDKIVPIEQQEKVFELASTCATKI